MFLLLFCFDFFCAFVVFSPGKLVFFADLVFLGGFSGPNFGGLWTGHRGGLVGVCLVQNPISFCLKPHGGKFSPI